MFTVGVTGASTTLINTTYNVSAGTNYTYIVFGPLTGVGAILGNDAFNDPGNGFFSLRVVNAAPGSSAVDIYLTAPGADIASSAPTLTNISYGVTSAFAPIAIGTSFEIRVTTTGTKDVLFDSTPKTFAEHSATDLVVFSKGSGKLVNVALLNHDSAGTGAIVDNLLAQYKVINASLVPSALNIFRRWHSAAVEHSRIPASPIIRRRRRERTASASKRRRLRARRCWRCHRRWRRRPTHRSRWPGPLEHWPRWC